MPSVIDNAEEDDDFDGCIFPLTDINDDFDNNNHVKARSNASKPTLGDVAEDTVAASGRFRRVSVGCSSDRPHGMQGFQQPIPQRRMSLKMNIGGLHNSISGLPMSPNSAALKGNWMQAIRKIKHMKDPWEDYHILDMPAEPASFHRYNALKKKWIVDKVEVKMEKQPFDQGAMRVCYRMKKISSYSSREWKHAQNYVAKKYMAPDVGRDVYLADVRLQMDAKLWGEEYNRHNPPKKVDILQMGVLEFDNRPSDDRYYHLEHYIEGHYTKYNSNSGFVEENIRFTPQAFSHFTFERSGHQLIVIDIQGVGDLYTDPQIHTADGTSYGDGNLGPRGMALFFHSHVCNPICESLSLSKFDLAPSEKIHEEKVLHRQMSANTRVRGEEETCIAASPVERSNLSGFLERSRRMSICSVSRLSDASDPSEDEQMKSEEVDGDVSPCDSVSWQDEVESPISLFPARSRRQRSFSESEYSSMSESRSEEEERVRFHMSLNTVSRPACFAHELNMRNAQNVRRLCDSVLGQIHHELAKYHEMGRFGERGEDADMNAALFHERCAAELGVKEAMVNLASIYLGLQHELLMNVYLEKSADNFEKGVAYMLMAAEAGDRGAMLYMARAFDTGVGLGEHRTRSHFEAIKWYEAAVNMSKEDETGEFDATMDSPAYELKAKMAELYLAGEYGLEKDPSYAGDLYTEAAECATAAMKGRIASKYYALADDAYAAVPD